MTTTLRVALLLSLAAALPARADDKAAPADPMAGWKPPVVKHADQDHKEIAAFFKKMEEAGTKGDLEAAAALIDFPVLMVTDDSKGEAGGESWSREQWTKVMQPYYAKPMPAGSVTHGKPTVVLVSDSLAITADTWTMKMGPKSVKGTSAVLLVRKGGTWKGKAMVEGGWGDMPMDGAMPAKDPAAK